MIIVIPYRNAGSEIELTYALRSAEAYIPFASGLMIVGDRPQSLKNFMHIQAEDNPHGIYRERNIYKKLLLAVQHPQVSEDFIYMHDDHFLLTPHNIIPDYYCNYFGGNMAYQNTVRNTNSEKNFDVHVPKVFNKRHFLQTVGSLNWDVPYGYCIKTEYCKTKPANNFYEYPDMKIRKASDLETLERLIKKRFWFSTSDKAMNGAMKVLLETLYPKPSRWEK